MDRCVDCVTAMTPKPPVTPWWIAILFATSGYHNTMVVQAKSTFVAISEAERRSRVISASRNIHVGLMYGPFEKEPGEVEL